ncbi:MAG TPA: RNA polymerase sigma factor [Vicinamibacterales bacterium]|jgi:RNA polymerase sigma-70 factor (ECF subfamily)|nr:RNA polymerase sigma factor [Vicinamibacterales bacterium]
MDGFVDRLPAGLLSVDDSVERIFEEALAESATLIFRVAYSVLRHRQDAEDVAQEAFVRAHQRFRQIRDRDKLRAWLVRLTWRLAIDHRRSARRRAARETEHVRSQPELAPPTDIVSNEQYRALWQAVDDLPEKLRVVIVLANMDGHDIDTVSRLLEIPPGTVKSRLFQARARLRRQLEGL